MYASFGCKAQARFLIAPPTCPLSRVLLRRFSRCSSGLTPRVPLELCLAAFWRL
jgi:hypothetical protein